MKTHVHILGVVVALVALMGIGALNPQPTPSYAQQGPVIERLMWSPDGSHLAAITSSSIYWLDVNDLSAAPVLMTFNDYTYAHAISPDNSRLAIMSHVFDTETGQQVFNLGPEDLDGGIGAVAFSADGRWVAGGATATLLFVADAQTGEMVVDGVDATGDFVDEATVPIVNAIEALAFSPDGTRLALSDASGHWVMWDTATWEPIGVGTNYNPVGLKALTFNADGTRLLTKDAFFYPSIWDTATLENLTPDNYRGYRSDGETFWDDGRAVVVMPDDDGIPWLYDLEAGAWIEAANFGELRYDRLNFPRSVLHANGTLIFREDLYTPFAWVNINTGETRLSEDFSTGVNTLSPDGQWLAYSVVVGSVTLWDGATTQVVMLPPQ